MGDPRPSAGRLNHKLRHVLRLLVVLAFASGCAGPSYDSAMAAFDRQAYAEALPRIRALAEAGHAPAQNTLGVMYDQGLGQAADIDLAVLWFRRAAGQGDAKAQANLGVLHEQGRGVARDVAEAARWYRLAAAQRRGVAENNLAALLAAGRLGPPDLVEAYVLFDRAARDYPAAADRASAAANRDAVARRMTPEQLAEAKRRLAQSEPSR